MVTSIKETSRNGRFWRLRATLRSISFILWNREYVQILVGQKDGHYELAVHYVGIKAELVADIVEDWVKHVRVVEANFARRGGNSEDIYE